VTSQIHCPHCEHTLREPGGQGSFMCPYCGQFFVLGQQVKGALATATPEASGAAATDPGCPYIIPEQPRPAGVTAIGVIGVAGSGGSQRAGREVCGRPNAVVLPDRLYGFYYPAQSDAVVVRHWPAQGQCCSTAGIPVAVGSNLAGSCG